MPFDRRRNAVRRFPNSLRESFQGNLPNPDWKPTVGGRDLNCRTVEETIWRSVSAAPPHHGYTPGNGLCSVERRSFVSRVESGRDTELGKAK